MAERTWETRELPILEEIGRHDLKPAGAEGSDILIASGLSDGEAFAALRGLDQAGYLTAQKFNGWTASAYRLLRLTERGRRAIGQWPGEDPYEDLVSVLRELVAHEADPERKSRLERVLSAMVELGKSAGSDVIAAWVKGRLGNSVTDDWIAVGTIVLAAATAALVALTWKGQRDARRDDERLAFLAAILDVGDRARAWRRWKPTGLSSAEVDRLEGLLTSLPGVDALLRRVVLPAALANELVWQVAYLAELNSGPEGLQASIARVKDGTAVSNTNLAGDWNYGLRTLLLIACLLRTEARRRRLGDVATATEEAPWLATEPNVTFAGPLDDADRVWRGGPRVRPRGYERCWGEVSWVAPPGAPSAPTIAQ